MSFANTNSDGAPQSPGKAAAVQRIVLTGFMGSGKSTIGRRLAEQLGWQFVDLDSTIERRDGRSVPQIFAEDGETAFRAMEADALNSCLAESQIVLALGGGALETPANRAALAASARTCVVLLTASFDTLFARCEEQIARAAASSLPIRPLLGDREGAMTRLGRRDPVYRQCAHLVLETTGQQPEESLHSLLKLLKDRL